MQMPSNQLSQALQQFKANPMQFIMRSRFNIPANLTNDPSAMVNYLLQTNQVSQDAVNRAYQQMGRLR